MLSHKISTMKKTQVFRTAVGVVATASVLMAGSAFAAPKNFDKTAKSKHGLEQRVNQDHFLGRVIAVNGTNFTITKPGMRKGAPEISYTVTTSGATTYKKDGKAAAFSDLAIGSIVNVNGTIDKTSSTISATSVNMSTVQHQAKKEKKHFEKRNGTSEETKVKHGKNKRSGASQAPMAS